jgi:hypothetical protein
VVTIHKKCKKCGVEKPLTEFYMHYKKYYSTLCRECTAKYHAEHYQKHKDRYEAKKREYKEKNKEQIKVKRKEKYNENREALLKKNKEYRAAHPEIIAAKLKRWYKNNKERYEIYRKKYHNTSKGKKQILFGMQRRRILENKSKFTLTYEQWEKILASQKNRCSACGKTFNKKLKPTKDHIVPLSKGGGYTFENIQALCLSCNCKKATKLDQRKIITWFHINQNNGVGDDKNNQEVISLNQQEGIKI